MCHDILITGDIGAICKSRGFSGKEASSRAVFENFFLSNIGVEAALASLSDNEITLLHLLKLESAVDISFFEKLYADQKSAANYSYPTFTQRYTPIFKSVYRALVRKGVLIIATAQKKADKAPKMEKWRFHFPQAFAALLPPLFRKTLLLEGECKVKQDILRQKVLGIMKPGKLLPFDNVGRYHLCLKQSQLLIGEKPFTVERLLAWQQIYWYDSVLGDIKQKRPKKNVFTGDDLAASKIERNEFPSLINNALATLEPNQWISANALSCLLRFFYYGTTAPNSKTVCETGWQLGCLAKQTEKGRDYYRLSPAPQPENSKADNYLTVSRDGAVEVNIKIIPYASLAHLAAISNLQIAAGKLKATPHFIRMGNVKEEIWNHPLTTWIKENSPAYQKVMTQIATRRGKRIVHDNLLLARVKDLSLKVQIQKKYANSTSVVFLPNDFIAFPPDFFVDIQKLVTKAGYVIKLVRD